jgi:serine/threonine protein kinase/tetratricopeptide (TPR) repeat protein
VIRGGDVHPGTVIAQRFVLDREAGSGGMGTVYCAFDRETGGPVAIKILRGHGALDVERFTQEAAILAELSHPAIVRYLANGVADSGEHWLAMEWLDGVDLADRLARGPLPIAEALALAARAADALASAHARGMVHRDLKPGNLFLPDGDVTRVKLVDFGIARVAGDPRRLTRTGMLMGTIGYIAPEQINGANDADPRADVFALGCVLYECITGRPAFAGVSPMAVLAKILLQGSPLLGALRPDLPEDLRDLVERMMALDPARRPRDGGEVAAALARLPPIVDHDPPASLRSWSKPIPPLPTSSRGGPMSLGLAEARLVSLVLAGEIEPAEGALSPSASDERLPEIEAAVAAYGGRVALAAGRSLVVTIWSNGDATDRAERAADCALAVRARAAGLPVCVVTGRGQLTERMVGGELVDRGVSVLRETEAGVVRLDEATASALGSRHHVERDAKGYVLHGASVEAKEPAPRGDGSPFVGRDRELAMLLGMFDGCAAEPMASAVLVVGPSGAGKSRLCRELEARIDGRAAVLVGRGESLDTGSPYGLIADAVRRAAGIRDDDMSFRRRRKLEDRVRARLSGPTAARVAAFLGELARTPFPDDAHEALRAARRDPMLMGDSILRAFEDWLAAECRAGPVVLVLEDLQWSDAATVRLVDGALRNLHDLPLLVLALARPEVLARFPGLLAERDLHLLRLGPLPRRASEALVRDRLGAGAGAETIARVVEQGGGNPFYLQELARAVAAGRGDALPASVLDAVEARLDAEGGEAKRVLRAASIFGRRFSRHGIAALTGMAPDGVEEWLARLEAREIVAPTSARTSEGDADYGFRHALVREAAYATLTEEDRALGHQLAGEWLERTGHADAMAMATHFRRGGQPWRSAPWYLRAAEQALGASELGTAIERAEEGLACVIDAPATTGGLRLVQAEAHMWRGELALAFERGGAATLLLEPGCEAWFRAATQVVLAAGKLGDLDSVEAWSDTVSTTDARPDAAGARIACLGFCVSQLVFGGRLDAADRMLGAIDEALSGPEPDAETRAFVHQAQGFRASAAGDLGACLEALLAALDAFEEAGDRRNACVTRSNLGHVYAELGAYDRAEEALRAALAAAHRMGLADLASVAQSNLGLALAHRGQLDEARRVELSAVEAFRRQGDLRLLGLAHAYLARIALAARDLDAAERAARAAVETLAAVPPLLSFARAVLARVLLAAGRLHDARAAAGAAYATLEAQVEIEEGEALVRLTHAEALLACGDAAEVPGVLAAARDRLLGRAARIRDEAWRERFLADVADNARTLALAET